MNSMQKALVCWNDHFQALLDQYDSFGTHKGERGERRENALAEVLRKYMPDRYQIASGEVVAVSGETSHQVDVIIYDRFHSPLLTDANDTKVVPAESVYAAIEVKPNMSSIHELHEALDNIRSVKRLPRTAVVPSHGGHRQVANPTSYGAVVTYGKHLKHETVREEMIAYCAAWNNREWVDQICFLGTAILTYATQNGHDTTFYRPEDFPKTPPTPVLIRYEKIAFGWFLLEMLYHLSQMDLAPPDFQKYMREMRAE